MSTSWRSLAKIATLVLNSSQTYHSGMQIELINLFSGNNRHNKRLLRLSYVCRHFPKPHVISLSVRYLLVLSTFSFYYPDNFAFVSLQIWFFTAVDVSRQWIKSFWQCCTGFGPDLFLTIKWIELKFLFTRAFDYMYISLEIFKSLTAVPLHTLKICQLFGLPGRKVKIGTTWRIGPDPD